MALARRVRAVAARTLVLAAPAILQHPVFRTTPLGRVVRPSLTTVTQPMRLLGETAVDLLVERLTGSSSAAFIAGLIYACSSYRFEHYSHLELQMTHWMPLALLALHFFVSSGRWPYAIALGLAAVAQLYSAMYYAAFLPLYAAAIGAGLTIVYRPSLRRLLLPAVVAALLAGVIAVPLARAFIAAQPLRGERPTDEIRYYSATPFDYLRANRHSALWRDRMPSAEAERALFPGVAPLALGALGLAPPRFTQTYVAVASALAV